MIIFLDIDGVITTRSSYKQHLDLLDRKCICCLNRLTDTLKADIVVSSTWRWENFDLLVSKLKNAGVKAKIIGITPIPNKHGELFTIDSRGMEIKLWIEQNNYQGDYIVIDDEVSDILKEIPNEKIMHIKNGMSKGGLTDTIICKYLEGFIL